LHHIISTFSINDFVKYRYHKAIIDVHISTVSTIVE